MDLDDLAGSDEEGVHEGTAAVNVGAYTSTPQFTADEVDLLRLRLAQGLSAEVQEGTAKPGQWLITGYDPEDVVTVVPLLFARRREYRPDPDTRAIQCRSEDGETGKGNPGGLCMTCQFANWTPDPRVAGKNNPPQCTPITSYIGYSITHGEIVSLSFSRTSSGAAKFINFIISTRGMGNFAVDLKTQQKKSARGSFYVPTVSIVDVDPSEIKAARAAFFLN
jgi:hypothetical protein